MPGLPCNGRWKSTGARERPGKWNRECSRLGPGSLARVISTGTGGIYIMGDITNDSHSHTIIDIIYIYDI